MFLKDAEGTGPGAEAWFLPEQPPTTATRAHNGWTLLQCPASCEAASRATAKTLTISVLGV